jgi:phenylacetate-CoA ligase
MLMDGLTRSFYRHLLIPSFETVLKRRSTFRYLRELERSQWLPPVVLEELQFDLLWALVRHAFASCPYYRERWHELGLGPAALKEPADFQRWPVLDRDTINTHRFQMRARTPGLRLMAKSTGGSSGVPLHFDLDMGSYERRSAAWHRGYSWADAGPGAKCFYLWGAALGRQARWTRWKDGLFNRLYRRQVVNSFAMSEQTMPAILEQLNRRRPEVIVAYTNPLVSLARWLDEHKQRPFAPRSIVVGAEKLHDFQRELLQEVFQAPVYETYGSREFMLIGAECERHEGLHLTMENLLVEILDEDGMPTPPGEEGDVVITDLFNYGMPFVRYRIGDRAVAGWQTCSCGRGLPLMRPVTGRRLDMIHTPDGRMIPGEFFPHLFKEFRAVKQFQIVQVAADRLRVDMVLGPHWNETERSHMLRHLADVLGPAMDITLNRVAGIALTAAGKHRVVVNQVCQLGSRSDIRATEIADENLVYQ